MDEAEAIEFFDDVVGDSQETKREEYVLEADNGRELEIYVEELDRTYVIDKLNELPDEMLEQMAQVEADEIEEEEAAEAAGGLSGDAIRSFEELCAEGMENPHLDTIQFEAMARELSLEVLFEIAGIIIELSLEDDGRITGFRKVD